MIFSIVWIVALVFWMLIGILQGLIGLIFFRDDPEELQREIDFDTDIEE